MYISSIDWLQRKINKYCYIFCLFPIIVLAFFDWKYKLFDKFLTDESRSSSLLGICGILASAVLLTLFIPLPKNSEYAKRFRKYGHDKIFAISSVGSALFFFLYIFLCLLSLEQTRFALYVFICGVSEMLVVFYYAFRMAIDSSRT